MIVFRKGCDHLRIAGFCHVSTMVSNTPTRCYIAIQINYTIKIYRIYFINFGEYHVLGWNIISNLDISSLHIQPTH